jgi:hypothetical protein
MSHAARSGRPILDQQPVEVIVVELCVDAAEAEKGLQMLHVTPFPLAIFQNLDHRPGTCNSSKHTLLLTLSIQPPLPETC